MQDNTLHVERLLLARRRVHSRLRLTTRVNHVTLLASLLSNVIEYRAMDTSLFNLQLGPPSRVSMSHQGMQNSIQLPR